MPQEHLRQVSLSSLKLGQTGELVRQECSRRFFVTMNVRKLLNRGLEGTLFSHTIEFHERLDVFHECVYRQPGKVAVFVSQYRRTMNHFWIAAGQQAIIPEVIFHR